MPRADASLIEPRRQPGPRRPETAFALNREWDGARRRFAAPTTRDPAAWRRWRAALRRALRRTLRLDALGPVPTPRPLVLRTCREDGYRRHRIAYRTVGPHWVTAYLLVPDRAPGAAPGPAAVCAHGHFPGGKETVVRPGHPYGVAYGHELARRGVVVLAPDNAGMGERDVPMARRTSDEPVNGCFLAWARLNHVGLDLTGLRVFELMAGMNLLAARADVDPRRIGAAGLSGGCWLSQVLAALDPRVRAVVLSGYFTTFAQTAWHGHCICHHPAGIGLLCDMPDLSALIAPRPQFVEAGRRDHAYPLEPAFGRVARAYRRVGARCSLGLDHHDGAHRFRGVASLPWLVDRLLEDP